MLCPVWHNCLFFFTFLGLAIIHVTTTISSTIVVIDHTILLIFSIVSNITLGRCMVGSIPHILQNMFLLLPPFSSFFFPDSNLGDTPNSIAWLLHQGEWTHILCSYIDLICGFTQEAELLLTVPLPIGSIPQANSI